MKEKTMTKLRRLLILIIATAVLVLAFLFVGIPEPKISVDNPARKLIEQIEAGEAYRFDGEFTLQRNGRTVAGEMIIAGAPNEGLFYMNQVMGDSSSENRVIVFYDNENSTMIMTALESINLGNVDLATYEERSEKTKEGVGTVNGRRLPYIRYESKNASSSYYVDGDKIYALEIRRDSNEDVVTLIVDNYSSEIPDEFFQIPSEYANYRTVDNR